VGLLALAQPAEGKIVYTKTHHVIGQNSLYPLDLNQDGTIDFLILQWGSPGTSGGSNELWLMNAFGNAVEGNRSQQEPWPFAADLRNGAFIGRGRQFVSTTNSNGEVMVRAGCSESCWTSGQWLNVRNRYLGLRFQINGKNHYGWARMSVRLGQDFEITATLTGYAYETVPQRGIRAGQTSGQKNSGSAVAKPASDTLELTLGGLALGASGVSSWRRR